MHVLKGLAEQVLRMVFTELGPSVAGRRRSNFLPLQDLG